MVEHVEGEASSLDDERGNEWIRIASPLGTGNEVMRGAKPI